MKTTYIYRVLAGHGGKFDEEDFFMYARNSKDGREFCKEHFRAKKYDSYKLIKVGFSHVPQETQIITGRESEQLRNTQAVKGDRYREIRDVPQTPTFCGVQGEFIEKVSGESL